MLQRRPATRTTLVAFRGNRYSVPPGHTGEIVQVRHRLGTATLQVSTARGITLGTHRRAPDGAGSLVRADEHVAALTRVVLGEFPGTDRALCQRKHRRPPSVEARAEADRIRRTQVRPDGEQVVIDFDAYASAARPLRGRTGDDSASGTTAGRDGRESS